MSVYEESFLADREIANVVCFVFAENRNKTGWLLRQTIRGWSELKHALCTDTRNE